MDGSDRLHEIWFRPEFQIKKKYNDFTSIVDTLTQQWDVRKLSLKYQAEVVKVYIISIINYSVTVVYCPYPTITKLERLLFPFMWKGKVPSVNQFISRQHPLNEGLGRHAL